MTDPLVALIESLKCVQCHAPLVEEKYGLRCVDCNILYVDDPRDFGSRESNNA
jgi:hypothetical protein